jgi:flagellar assembly protein FliH
VKSSQLIIDKKKYVLNNDFVVPEKKVVEEPVERSYEPVEMDEDRRKEIDDELRIMKEEMLEAVKVESDRILSEAQAEKQSLIQQGMDQMQQTKESARQEGYSQGYEEGINKGYSEVNDLIEEALSYKDKYFSKFSAIKDESEAQLTQVIIDTVEKILNKHVKEDYELIGGLVETALEKCAYTAHLTLRVAPEDYDSAVSIKRYILSLTENVESIDIKQDNALKPGSCVIDTDAGSVDSSIHTQFENVKNKFIELLQSE